MTLFFRCHSFLEPWRTGQLADTEPRQPAAVVRLSAGAAPESERRQGPRWVDQDRIIRWFGGEAGNDGRVIFARPFTIAPSAATAVPAVEQLPVVGDRW